LLPSVILLMGMWHGASLLLLVLDPLADKIFVLTAFSALWHQGACPWWVVVAVGVRDLLVTALRSFLLARGAALRTSFLAKSKTAFQFAALYFFVFSLGRDGLLSFWISVSTVVLTVASSFGYLPVLWLYLSKKRG
jgi:phosphatidylglycerophosphate synthase